MTSLAITTWAIATAIIGVTLCLSLRTILTEYLLAGKRREPQSRTEAWAAYEPLNITETVATVAASAVAVRHMKFLDEETTRSPRAREVVLDFSDLRRIVRRMTASIRSGEARALRGRRIAWIHRENGEDDLEYNVLSSLGASVELYLDNEQLLEALRERDAFDIIVTNKRHFTSKFAERSNTEHDPRAGFELVKALKSRKIACPIIVYSRSLDDTDRNTFEKLQVFNSVTYPEDFIHSVLQAADEVRRMEQLGTKLRMASKTSAAVARGNVHQAL